jgi:hypothetical protein
MNSKYKLSSSEIYLFRFSTLLSFFVFLLVGLIAFFFAEWKGFPILMRIMTGMFILMWGSITYEFWFSFGHVYFDEEKNSLFIKMMRQKTYELQFLNIKSIEENRLYIPAVIKITSKDDIDVYFIPKGYLNFFSENSIVEFLKKKLKNITEQQSEKTTVH